MAARSRLTNFKVEVKPKWPSVTYVQASSCHLYEKRHGALFTVEIVIRFGIGGKISISVIFIFVGESSGFVNCIIQIYINMYCLDGKAAKKGICSHRAVFPQ